MQSELQQEASCQPPARDPAPCTCRNAGPALPLVLSTAAGNGMRSGRKVLRKALVGERLMAWYPPDPTKHDPLMLSIKAEK